MTNADLMEILTIADTIENNGGWAIAAVKLRAFVGEHQILAAKAAAEVAKWQNSAVEDQARIAQIEAALTGVEAKLAEYLERLLQGRTLPNRWVGEINDIVQAAKRASAPETEDEARCDYCGFIEHNPKCPQCCGIERDAP